jgi:F-type H+-transporting ATPase subunit delta
MVEITATTARVLPKPELAALEQLLSRHYGDVKLEVQVDPQIIGGIRLRVGTTEIDATIAAKLQTIKQQLLRL